MKYRSDGKSIFIVLILLLIGFSFIAFIPSFDFKTKQVSLTFFISVISLAIAFIIYFITDRVFRYYKVEKKDFVIKKFFSQEIIPFKNIIYIDRSKLKKGILRFYTKKGKKYDLVLDNKKELISVFEKKCTSLYSAEKFHQEFINF